MFSLVLQTPGDDESLVWFWFHTINATAFSLNQYKRLYAVVVTLVRHRGINPQHYSRYILNCHVCSPIRTKVQILSHCCTRLIDQPFV